MNGMIGQARHWLDGRTARERMMLTAMIGLVAVVAAWLLVVRPAWAWRVDAADRLARAERAAMEVRAGLRLVVPTSGAKPAVDAQGLEPLVRQTAEAVGLEVVTEMAPGGGLGFRIQSGSSAAVFGWLATLQTAHGVQVRSLGVIENADASLQVEGGLGG